ncbi:MAG: hypothetical protein Kilf2KO_01240 [Rhodospirillales bacterium]
MVGDRECGLTIGAAAADAVRDQGLGTVPLRDDLAAVRQQDVAAVVPAAAGSADGDRRPEIEAVGGGGA